jgi:hypothetical protein
VIEARSAYKILGRKHGRRKWKHVIKINYFIVKIMCKNVDWIPVAQDKL